MKATIQVINQMQADGVIGRYAIGGAVGVLFYTEPAETEDIDVFVAFKDVAGGLVSLQPIYSYLKARGYAEFKKEGLVIEGWPVQFLPTVDALDDEAMAAAVQTDLEGVPVSVMTAEHLVAIALRTGRGKDFLRILSFIESGALDANKLEALLKRHHLVEKWAKFEDMYVKRGGLT